MMLTRILALVAALNLGGMLYAEGQESHGGDTVECKEVEGSAYKGFYNLDYLLTYKQSDNNRDIINVGSWEQSRDRIRAVLEASHPYLARSFATFLSFMDNTNDYARSRIWEEGAFGLVVVKPRTGPYQLIDRLLPRNCYNVENGDISLIRTITREKRNNLLVYNQDLQIINRLAAVQLSFLYIHEWLRDLSNDETIIRRVNRLLHSSVIEAKGYDLKKAISNIGLSAAVGEFVPVCRRSDAIKNLFEIKYAKHCSQIDSLLQKSNLILDFSHAQISELRPGDFSGSYYINVLYLNNNLIEDIPEGVFYKIDFFAQPYPNINSLDLSHGKIQTLAPRSFVDVEISEGSIDLSHNQIRRIPKESFVAVRSHLNKLWINFSHNQIEDIEAGAFFASFMSVVDFSHNKLKRIRKGAFNHHNNLNLSHNDIESIEEGAILCPSFTKVNLSNNKLTQITRSIVEQWANNDCDIEVDLRNNLFDNEWKDWLRYRLKDKVRLDENTPNKKDLQP